MNKKKYIAFVVLICMTVLTASMLYADGDKAGEEINWQVISNGGTEGTSANYGLKGTIGQTAVGIGGSTNHGCNHGFWQIFITGGPCQGKCGDANNDTSVNVSDAVWIINYVFIGGGAPEPVLACGDANTDATVNISDAVWIINYVFIGGGPPSTCSPGSWGGNDCCPFSL